MKLSILALRSFRISRVLLELDDTLASMSRLDIVAEASLRRADHLDL